MSQKLQKVEFATPGKRRGQLGLDSVKSFMILLITLAVVAIAMFVSLTALVDNNTNLNTKTVGGNSFTNVTTRLNQTVPQAPTPLVGLNGVTLAQIIAINSSGGEVVAPTNWTIVNGSLFQVAGASKYNSTLLNISANYQYTTAGNAVDLQNNITTGTSNFFANIPTVFTILGAVIIILAVSLILVAVSRFSQRSGAGL